MNHAMRCDLRRLGHWALEGLGLWQGFGLGGITSPFTVLSSLGSPSVMATTANGRESRLLVWGDSSRTPYFGRDIKAKKCTSVSQVAEAVYSTNLKKKNPICMPSHWQSLSGACANPGIPSYVFYYGLSSDAYQQIPKIIKGRRTDCCG